MSTLPREWLTRLDRDALDRTVSLLALTLLIALGSAGLFVREPSLVISVGLGRLDILRWMQVLLLITSLAYVSFRYALRRRTGFDELSFLLVLTCGVNFIVQLTGGVTSYWQSLYFLVGGLAAVAFSFSFVALTVGLALSLETANLLFHGMGSAGDLARLSVVFLAVVFTLHVVSRSERDRANRAEDRLLRLNGSLAAIQRDPPAEPVATEATSRRYHLQDWETHLSELLELSHLSTQSSQTLLLEVSGDDGYFRIRASFPEQKTSRSGRHPLSGSFVQRVLDDETPLTLRDVEKPLPKMVWQHASHNDRCMHFVPISRAHSRSWVLVLSHSDPDHFDEGRRMLARSIGAQLAETETLYLRQVRQQIEDIDNRRLLEGSEELARASGVSEIVRHVARYASRIGDLSSCAVCLLEEGREAYVVPVAKGYPKDVTEQRFLLELPTWAGWILRAREEPLAITMKRRSGMPILSPKENPFKEDTQFLAVPLRAPDRVIGALLITRPREPFSARDVRFLRIYCNQAAAAIQNAMAYDRVIRLAATDDLTGLFNRRYLEQALGRELARVDRSKGGLAVAIVDIDHFKRFNDTYGHAMGDVVLKRVAKALQSVLRKGDVLARYGGEEFVVLLPGLLGSGASESAERLRATVAEAGLHPAGGDQRVTVSIGWSLFPRDGEHPEILLENADKALYAAKEQGRNRALSYEDIEQSEQSEQSEVAGPVGS